MSEADGGLFGEVISSYSRAQAIEDGVLVDVTETAREAGFKCPVALTRTLWDRDVEVPRGLEGEQDIQGRLWDILWMLMWAAKKDPGRSEVLFGVYVKEERGRPPARHRLKSMIGPGDNGEAVMTVMLPEED